jgi:signal peptidase I
MAVFMNSGNHFSSVPIKPVRTIWLRWTGVGALAAGLVVASTIAALGWSGAVVAFHIPTGSMMPAVKSGDSVFAERFTFWKRAPRRGDIVVFGTDFSPSLPADSFFCKRVAGEPGEHLQICGGKLYINDQVIALTNEAGPIGYLPPDPCSQCQLTNVQIPAGTYFVLGDNSTNSNDSRFFGFVPAKEIVGRIGFCYWPPTRFGRIK